MNVWSTLRHSTFSTLWISSIFSNIGSKMHELTAVWLMTQLTDDPLWVGLIQAIHACSIMLFALIAGTLADMLNKRIYLISLQIFLSVISLLLFALSNTNMLTPKILLLLAFAIGLGEALSKPTWQSILPELVPHNELYSAVILNGVSINISRAIGPAIAGIIIAMMNLEEVFLINSIAFAVFIYALYEWNFSSSNIYSSRRFTLVLSEIKKGLNFYFNNKILCVTAIKSSIFFFFASASWTILPLVARDRLLCGPIKFSFLYVMFGTCAVIGSLFIYRLIYILKIDKLILLCSFAYFISLVCFIYSNNYWIIFISMGLIGMSWITIVSTLNSIVQTISPLFIKARIISIYQMIFYGSIALGSLFWGSIAKIYGNSFSLTTAAILILIGNTIIYFISLDHYPSIRRLVKSI
jgi:MFS family permease